jgi:glycosyltransferase involved in cell wall biosynthesis
VRVVFFTHTFTPDYTGGAEVSIYHTCQGLRRRGVECIVLNVTARRPGHRDEWYQVDSLPVHRITLRSWLRQPYLELFDGRIFGVVRRELRRLRPDLLHIHNTAHATLAPITAAWAARIPIVSTLHDLWLLCPNNMRYQADGSYCDVRHYPDGCGRCFRRYEYWAGVPNRRRWLQWLTQPVAAFISPSQALIDRHVEAGYDPRRFRLIPYGLQAPALTPPTHPGVQRIIAESAHRPTVVFAGGGVEIKGARLVIDALPAMLAAVPDLQVAVAGGGETRLLQEYAAFGPAVTVLGPVPFMDLRGLFGAADLTISPSVWHENSPVVIYENFQMGTPVVGSAIGGIPELIDEGCTGYLFAPGDAAGLAAKVTQHFRRPAWERRRMRQACLQKARGDLALDHHLDGLQGVYAEVLG